MSYQTLHDLPDRVHDNLPKHGLEIYKEAYKHAWENYKDPKKRRGNASREEVAHRVAWSAVKKVYRKDMDTGEWVRRKSKI